MLLLCGDMKLSIGFFIFGRNNSYNSFYFNL